MNARNVLPEKARIAKSFGRAADSYDRFARLQRDIADTLIESASRTSACRILDLGSGTGYCARQLKAQWPQSQVTSLDISHGMLSYARDLTVGGSAGEFVDEDEQWVCGDAEALPFTNNSFELVISSLTLQWCPRPEKFFGEISRVLTPGGKALVSTLAQHTLTELRQSWAEVDAHIHVNTFLAYASIMEAINASGFSRVESRNNPQYYYYASLQELMAELKGIGAHNLNAGQPAGLTGKSALKNLKLAFEQNSIPGKGVPVTYDLVLVSLGK